MPYWLGAGLWLATVATVAAAAVFGAACGWVLGYAHRDVVEWGRRCGRLLAWWRKHRMRSPLIRAYRELFADIWHLLDTGQLRPGKLAVQQEAPGVSSGGLF